MKDASIKGKSEQALEELFNSFKESLQIERRYHELLDNMKEGFQVIDFNWKYVYVNNAVVKQSKSLKEELIGYGIKERYPGIEKTEMFKALEDCMINRIPRKFVNEFIYPDQTRAWFELTIDPVVEGISVLSNDITVYKQNEQDRDQHIQEIEQLLFKISHEVRHPVCHILGISHLLENSLLTLEEFKTVISHVRKSVELLDVYTRELTNFVSEMRMTADKDQNAQPFSMQKSSKL
jgi:hypothetical protein